MENLTLKVLAMIISQEVKTGQTIYIAKIKAKDLVYREKERFDIRIYERKKISEGVYEDQGYQRAPSRKKVEEIKNFIVKETKNPLFPTAIITSTENKLDFEEIDSGFGFLYIKPKLHIIDGQHRWRAWTDLMKTGLYKQYENYEIPVVILSGFDELEEVMQFHIINSRQTKIKTDLAHNHYLYLMRKQKEGLIPQRDRWIARANVITKKLNEEIEGVWKGRISNANENADSARGKTISISSFASSLKPLFTRGKLFYHLENQDKNAELLAKYWDKIASVWPNALDRVSYRDYVLMKTVGVFSMHMLLSEMLNKYKDLSEAINEAYKIIKKADSDKNIKFDETFWFTKRNLVGERIDKGEYAAKYSSGTGHKYIVKSILSMSNSIETED